MRPSAHVRALPLEPDEATSGELQALRRRARGARQVDGARLRRHLGLRNHMPLTDLALPAVKAQPQKARDALLAELAARGRAPTGA